MSSLYNRARVSTATAGTGTITLGAATSNAFFTFAEAGVTDGTVVSYVIEDGTNVEMGIGTYTSSGTTLSRTTVTASKISGTAGTTKLTLSGSAVVYIDALAADIVPYTAGVAATGTTVGALTVNGGVGVTGKTFTSGLDVPIGSSFTTQGITIGNNAAIKSSSGYFGFYDGGGSTLVFEAGTNSIDPTIYFSQTNMTFRGQAGGATFLTMSASELAATMKETITINSAATNTVTYNQRYTSTSSGTPDVGIGVGVEFEVEAQAGVNKVGATVEAYAWDVTAASEDFDLVFKTMSAGATATEKGRTGFMPLDLIQDVDLTLLASYGVYAPDYYEISTGIALTVSLEAIIEIG